MKCDITTGQEYTIQKYANANQAQQMKYYIRHIHYKKDTA